jgi:hypothetical protein
LWHHRWRSSPVPAAECGCWYRRCCPTCAADQHHLLVVYQLVHASGAQGRSDGINYCHTGIDITDKLGLPLARVCPFFQKDDLRLLMLVATGVSVHWQMLPMKRRFSYHHHLAGCCCVTMAYVCSRRRNQRSRSSITRVFIDCASCAQLLLCVRERHTCEICKVSRCARPTQRVERQIDQKSSR